MRQLLDEAESKVFAIAEEGSRGQKGFLEIQPLLTQVVERIDELYHRDNQSDITGVPTGFVDLDRMTSGMQGGDLIIVAGRPSMGKTAFSLNIGEHVAVEQGLPVAVFSMEMAGTQLAMRMLGSVGRLDQHRLRTGRLLDEDWPRLTHAIQKMNDAQLFIDETPALNPMELRARSRRLARQCGQLGLIVIDYLQLIEPDNARDPRQEQVARIARRLKGLARDLKVPVLCLAQLNRQAEGSADHRPKLSHLRESGAIEQDADVVMFIHREEYYRRGEDAEQFAGLAEIIIAKQRNGPVGEIEVLWQKDFTRFVDKAPERLQAFDDFNSGAESGVAGGDPF